MSHFAEALALVLQMEGGRVDDPRDPGGRTNFGVTQRTYDAWSRAQGRVKRSVYAISRDDVEAIYRDDFARPLCFDRLAPGLGYAVLDAGVNSGPVRAVRWLQAALACRVTGHLESTTLLAAAHADPVLTVDRLCDARLGKLRHLPWLGALWARLAAQGRLRAEPCPSDGPESCHAGLIEAVASTPCLRRRPAGGMHPHTRPHQGMPMLTNKWIQFGLSAVVTALAGSASLDWSTVVTPTHAAAVATGIAAVKAVLNLLAPGPGTPVQPTGGRIVTHQAI